MDPTKTRAERSLDVDGPRPQLARDVVPTSVGDALRTFGRELRTTVRAYLRMIEWQKDVSWKQVTLASIDRMGFAVVGVAVALRRAVRKDRQPPSRDP